MKRAEPSEVQQGCEDWVFNSPEDQKMIANKKISLIVLYAYHRGWRDAERRMGLSATATTMTANDGATVGTK